MVLKTINLTDQANQVYENIKNKKGFNFSLFVSDALLKSNELLNSEQIKIKLRELDFKEEEIKNSQELLREHLRILKKEEQEQEIQLTAKKKECLNILSNKLKTESESEVLRFANVWENILKNKWSALELIEQARDYNQ